MKKPESRSGIEMAAQNLRRIVLDMPPGALIGSEDVLIARLGSSRSTVRQVARLLEREGLLKVRRGINGGYFSSRPDAGTIEATLSTHLQLLDINPADTAVVASALWTEVVRKAAAAPPDAARPVAERLIARIKALKDSASFEQVREVELTVLEEVFTLAQSAFVKLIFDINVTFARRTFPEPSSDDGSETHMQFVRAWKDAKLLEISAIGQGDAELAALASHYTRKVWERRMASRYPS